MINMDEEFYICQCGCNAISVCKYDVDEVGITLWKQGYDGNHTSFKNRLRHAWYCLKNGHPYEDYVILNKKETQSLIERLKSIIEPNDGE